MKWTIGMHPKHWLPNKPVLVSNLPACLALSFVSPEWPKQTKKINKKNQTNKQPCPNVWLIGQNKQNVKLKLLNQTEPIPRSLVLKPIAEHSQPQNLSPPRLSFLGHWKAWLLMSRISRRDGMLLSTVQLRWPLGCQVAPISTMPTSGGCVALWPASTFPTPYLALAFWQGHLKWHPKMMSGWFL